MCIRDRAVEQQEADQQQEAEREVVRKKKSASERIPVSYTHLDVYKRQPRTRLPAGLPA